MTFQEMLGEVQKIPSQEIRAKQDNYLEVVFGKANWENLLSVLQAYFGAPLKPEGKQPSEDAKRYAGPYGGIYKNQTLYYRKNEKTSEVALLWPWGSGTTLTVKIVSA